MAGMHTDGMPSALTLEIDMDAQLIDRFGRAVSVRRLLVSKREFSKAMAPVWDVCQHGPAVALTAADLVAIESEARAVCHSQNRPWTMAQVLQ
jgi:hypothetical protein